MSQVYDSFPTLYRNEWLTEFQETHDQIGAHVDSYDVSGDRKQFKRLKKVGGSTVKERTDPTRLASDRRRIGDTNLGETEIINLFTTYHAADDCEIERTEIERLGPQESPGEAFKVNQKAEIIRRMNSELVNGILRPRQLGKLGTTADPIPSSNIITGASGFNYSLFDDVYTDLGAAQVLGQGIEGSNHGCVCIRHKDLQKFRNDPTISNRDFSDVRAIDSGKVYMFREFYLIVLPDAAFADQVDAGATGTVRLPMFARPAVAWGKTGETYAEVQKPSFMKGGMVLELEEAFGCTSLDWTGVRGLEVPV